MDSHEIETISLPHGSTLVASTENDEASCLKKRKSRLSEAQKLAVSTSSSERSRKGNIELSNRVADLPAPRTRPQSGALVDQGIVAVHSRPNASGLYHWSQYGNLPHANTREVIDKDGNLVKEKVFEWRGLFQKINGRKTFVAGKKGGTKLSITEAHIDFWDRVRIKWLAKRYGRHYRLNWAPTESLMRTWHTSELCTILFVS